MLDENRHVFPRHTRIEPPIVVGGEGCYLIDRDGKRYLDGSGGAAVSCLGHGDPEVTEKIKAQLDRIAFAQTAFMSSEPAEALAALLAEKSPGLDRAFFVSGGSEAVEAAIKLARQYAIEVGRPSKHRIISRRQSYHGSTLGALGAGGNAWRREPYAPLLVEASHIAPCYPYRDQRDDETAEQYGQRTANELEAEIAAGDRDDATLEFELATKAGELVPVEAPSDKLPHVVHQLDSLPACEASCP